MNILIFGASGKTGLELVRQGLLQEQQVTAFVRNPDKLSVIHFDRLKIIQGDVKDFDSVSAAIKNQDVVISALGVSQPLKNDQVVVEGIRNIIRAMQEMKVNRLIYLSFIGVGVGRKDAGFLIKNIISKIVRKEIEDHAEKERLIKNSQLEWTIIHPPKLTNDPGKNNYRTGENIKANQILPTLSRVDLADFMLKQVKDKNFIHKTARILY